MTDEERAAAVAEAAKAESEQATEITSLKEQLGTATERLNKYDGERKDLSEQNNIIDGLKAQVESLQKTVQDNEDEDTKHLSVTQEEMKNYKEGEAGRFAEYNKGQAAKVTEDQAEYQKYLGQESLSVKDETLFDAICKEHDALVANGGMPESTGDLKADAKIAWREAENSYYRKKLASQGTIDFKDVNTVTKPIIPGQKELSAAVETKQTTTMPDNLPDDAKEFIAMTGMKSDSVNKALGRT